MRDVVTHLKTTAELSGGETARVRAWVAQAADIVTPVWPLERFIACNPLLGLEDKPFAEAVREGERLFDGAGYRPLAAYQADYRAGRIDADGLDRSFARHFPNKAPLVRIGAKSVDAASLLRARLTGALPTAADVPETLATAAARKIESLPSPSRDFAEPMATGGGNVEAANWIDSHVVKICSVFLDSGLATLPMPHRELGLYRAWRKLAPYDPDLTTGTPTAARRLLNALPEAPEATIMVALKEVFGIHDSDSVFDVLSRELAALRGWAGFIKQRHSEGADKDAPADPVGYLGIRLALVLLAHETGRDLSADGRVVAGDSVETRVPMLARLACHAGLSANDLDTVAPTELENLLRTVVDVPEASLSAVYLDTVETSYRTMLLGKLLPKAQDGETGTSEVRPRAQAVFCIDVRSEVFRRHLEQRGTYQTLGYAGFFGLPMRYHGGPDDHAHAHCPPLLSVKHEVAEAPRADRLHEAHAVAARRQRNTTAGQVYKGLKGNIAAAFGLVEGAGPLSGLAMATRTLTPGGFAELTDKLFGSTALGGRFKPALRQQASAGSNDIFGLSRDEQVFYAHAMFQLTGLAAPFGRLLLICGHGSTTTNNPYAAALDCGACGGRRGGPNARVMASILNSPEVRERLAEVGVELPADCIALAGEHDTATDHVTLYDTDTIPASHAGDLATLERDLAAAGASTRLERGRRLPGVSDDPHKALYRRSMDWAQVRPEWGLAGNAALIVGPRAWTRSVDLGGRCFLHDYDWRQDPRGEALTVILTAPMVVAHWICSQYYFSTVDNRVYGSGDKTTQNVVGGFGVMQGNASDLKTGLPQQSVMDDESRPYHTPQRLLTVIRAPRQRVEGIIAANDILRRLFGNGWVKLTVVDPEDGAVYHNEGVQLIQHTATGQVTSTAADLRHPMPTG